MTGSKKTRFLDENFVLETESSRVLYHQFAAALPILDYHNHLSPKDIATDRQFNNLTEIWLEGDHYKWRAMRINGIPERFCTGDATPEEKFTKWAETVPFTMRNPLYHWTHLELKNYFGVNTLLNKDSAAEIYQDCNEKLSQKEFSTLGLLKKMKVEVVCTTDDPIDSLEHHRSFASSGHALSMYPTFRPDRVLVCEDPLAWKEYINLLAEAAKTSITNYDDLISALAKRVDYFDSVGCRASDHGLEQLYFATDAETVAPSLFGKLMSGKQLDENEMIRFRCAVLLALGRMYAAKGWVQQYHLGALRNNNSRLLGKLGKDTGFDSIGDFDQAKGLSGFLNALDKDDKLAKTILYNNNPSDNEIFATMIGNFNDGSVPGKVQFGSGWWFLDQKDGMEKQMNALSNMGLLSRFVGMVTDSRSFLSFPRHEYFRRILCNLWGNDVEKGYLPDDLHRIGEMIERICYYNARDFFNFKR